MNELTLETAGRAALLDKAFLNDSWGHPFQYKRSGKFQFEVNSAGPDGKMGSKDDVTN